MRYLRKIITICGGGELLHLSVGDAMQKPCLNALQMRNGLKKDLF